MKKNLTSQIPLLISIVFFAVYSFWLDDIQKLHYLWTDIEFFEKKSFYNILIIEVTILSIALIWQLKKSTVLTYLKGISIYILIGVLTFYFFEKIYISIALPLNRVEIINSKSRSFIITSIIQNDNDQKTIRLTDLETNDYLIPYFVVKNNDTTNYRENDTILIKFKIGKFGLRFDPTNELNTFKLINPF